MFQKIESPLAKLEISYAETLFHVFFLTSDMNKLRKIHQLCCKIAKFESYLLKTNKDIAPQIHEILRWGQVCAPPPYKQL